MAKREPAAIRDVIRGVIRELDKDKRVEADHVLRAWVLAAGKKIIRHTRPQGLKGNKLVINVDGSAWMYELGLSKDVILKRMQKKLGKDTIKDIQFRIGEL